MLRFFLFLCSDVMCVRRRDVFCASRVRESESVVMSFLSFRDSFMLSFSTTKRCAVHCSLVLCSLDGWRFFAVSRLLVLVFPAQLVPLPFSFSSCLCDERARSFRLFFVCLSVFALFAFFRTRFCSLSSGFSSNSSCRALGSLAGLRFSVVFSYSSLPRFFVLFSILRLPSFLRLSPLFPSSVPSRVTGRRSLDTNTGTSSSWICTGCVYACV